MMPIVQRHPFTPLTAEYKMFLRLKYGKFSEWTFVDYVTPMQCEDLCYKVENGWTFRHRIEWDSPIPLEDEVYFERKNEHDYILYLINPAAVTTVFPCPHDFIFLVNKTMNPQYDEAFRIILDATQPLTGDKIETKKT